MSSNRRMIIKTSRSIFVASLILSTAEISRPLIKSSHICYLFLASGLGTSIDHVARASHQELGF